jgi:hypothetical protein
LLVILVNLGLFATGVLSHLGPNKEMLHRAFEHVKAVEYPIDIFRANMLLRSSLRIVRRFLAPFGLPTIFQPWKTMIVQ